MAKTIRNQSTVTLDEHVRIEAEESRARLNEAQAAHTKWKQESSTAKDQRQGIETSWRNGAEEFCADDLVRARAEEERAVALFAAAERAVKRARRNLVNDDTTLAQALSVVVTKAVGLEPVVTPRAPQEPPRTLPALYIVQDQSGEFDFTSGAVSGNVTLLLFRNDIHRSLDAGEIERVADRATDRTYIRATPQASMSADGITTDEVTVEVKVAFPKVPLIASAPADMTLRTYAGGLAGQVSMASQRHDAPAVGVHVGTSGDASRTRSSVIGKVIDSRTLASEVDAQGIRTTTVEIAIAGAPQDKQVTYEEIAAHLTSTLSTLGGSMAYGVGRVESVSNVRITPLASEWGGYGRVGAVTLTCLSASPTA